MKSREKLIRRRGRLRRFQVGEKRRRVTQIMSMIAEFERKKDGRTDAVHSAATDAFVIASFFGDGCGPPADRGGFTNDTSGRFHHAGDSRHHRMGLGQRPRDRLSRLHRA